MKKTIAVLLTVVLLIGAISALADSWVCPKCGNTATGSFCPKCGKKKPAVTEQENTPTPEPEVAVTELPTEVSEEDHHDAPTEETTPLITESPTETPTEVPTPVPTETSAPAPTEVPQTKSYDFSQFGYGNSEVFIVPADVLYSYGGSYVGKVVVTSIIVEDKASKSLKAKTANNDTYSFSVVAEFSDKSEISSVKEGQTVIVIGTVDEMGTISLFGADKTVNLSNSHVVISGITTAEIENSHGEAVQTAENVQAEKATQAANAVAKAKQDYIDACVKIKYSDVERNPSKYKGTQIQVTGKVIQVSEGWFNSVTLRVQQSDGDIWYITYTRSDDEPRILENDKLTFYGKCTGVETYRTVLGGSVTIPAMEAKYYK